MRFAGLVRLYLSPLAPSFEDELFESGSSVKHADAVDIDRVGDTLYSRAQCL
jgi:hypothetical protein